MINYTINVANAGNMTLTGIDVSDPSVDGLALVSGDDGDGKLELTETWVYTASYTVTQDDIDNGGVVDPALTYDNTASVTTDQGTALPSPDPDANDSDTSQCRSCRDPSITLGKTATVRGRHRGHGRRRDQLYDRRHQRRQHDADRPGCDRSVGHRPRLCQRRYRQRQQARPDRDLALHRELHPHPGRHRQWRDRRARPVTRQHRLGYDRPRCGRCRRERLRRRVRFRSCKARA